MDDDTDAAGPWALVAQAAGQISRELGHHDAAVVLGSGWAEVATELGEIRAELPLGALAGAPAPSVPGHEGTLRSLRVGAGGAARDVLVVGGRSHLYEGRSPAEVVHPVRAAVRSGCRTVVLTNAAGSLRPEVAVGSAVLISDHLNLTGANPMSGAAPPGDPAGRFVDLGDLYSAELRARVRAVHPELSEGVYAGLLGGSFETPAEIRMLRTLGADLVGMSTVLEAIAARHLGARVLGVSLVTNLAAGLQDRVDHREVLQAGHASVGDLREVVRTVVSVLER